MEARAAVDGIGVDRDRRDAEPHEVFRELGPVRRSLPAQRRRDVRGACRGDDAPDRVEHRFVGLVEEFGTQFGIAIDAEHELREVVRADRHAVDTHRRIFRDPVHDGRDFGHDPPVQAALTSERARVEEFEARLELPARPDERNHHVQVRCLVTDASQELALEREEIRLAYVAVTAPVADHGIRLDRLELTTPFEVAEFVRAKVDRAVDDGPGRERACDRQERFRHPREELVATAACEKRARVYTAERVGDHELGTQEAHPVDRQGRNALRLIGDREIDVQPRCGRLDRGRDCR